MGGYWKSSISKFETFIFCSKKSHS
jgi:hypothetical protein